MSDDVLAIPEQGRAHEEVLADIDAARHDDADWQAGRTFSLVYYAGPEHTAFLKQAHQRLFSENGLNPLAFGSLRKFEAEVVRMTATMLNGGPEVAGTMTSGGSESIMMAMKTYRTWARAEKGEHTPNVVAPVTLHPAFDKACHYFDIELRKAPLLASGEVDVEALQALADDHTIAAVVSAPNYPNGVIDDVTAVGAWAAERGIGLHVDGCLGGFILPWVEALGHDIRPFDFRVEGVTSMSADVHKYGFAAKGASVVLYRDADLRRHQFFAATGWPGGLYVSPTAAGTRPGGSIAAAWAAMQAMGRDGYLAIAERSMQAALRMRADIEAVDGLAIVGEPKATVHAWQSTSDDLDVYAVADALEARGWHLNRQIRPSSVHAIVGPRHMELVDEWAADVKAAADEVRGRPELSGQGQAAMYGMMASVPEGSEAETELFVKQMLDGLYEV